LELAVGATAQGVIGLANNTLLGKAGLISCLREFVIGPGEPRLFAVGSVTASLERVSAIQIPGTQGAVGFSYEEAALGAIGETIERYCAACYEWDDLIYASKNELGDDAIGMDQFQIYTEDVYARSGLARWSPDVPIYWVEGISLHSRARRFVPAALVYLPFRKDDPRNSPKLALSVSTGQACHTDRIQALLCGLYEAIERDAFTITWMRRIPPTRIDYREDPFLEEIYRRYFECGSIQLHVFDITLDLRVPTMFCVATGMSRRGPFLTVGAATRHSEREAILKAMKEACQGAAWAWELMESRADWHPLPDFSNLEIFEDHVRLYCEPEMMPHMDFIMKTARHRVISGPEPPAKGPELVLQKTLDELARYELEAVAVDLTTPEIAELGFCSVKVLVPGLAPLTAKHVLPALASRRYTEVPVRLGLTDSVHYDWNPAPHPFP
jgi:ribosomal protein S12 methylthiotransferase accessory factor